jgi:hypothetical protein
VDQYIHFGLLPMTDYETVDLSKLGGELNHLNEWNKMVKGQQSRLHFPALILPKYYGGHVIVVYLWRDGDYLYLRGGFHPKVSDQTSSIKIKIHFKICFTKIDETLLVRHQHRIVDIQHKEDDDLLIFLDIPWSNLSVKSPPSVNISIEQIDLSSECS